MKQQTSAASETLIKDIRLAILPSMLAAGPLGVIVRQILFLHRWHLKNY